jgi:hypothetical protein
MGQFFDLDAVAFFDAILFIARLDNGVHTYLR